MDLICVDILVTLITLTELQIYTISANASFPFGGEASSVTGNIGNLFTNLNN